ncbi:MAG: hypothetical protein QXJ28_03250 [Candidatus Pacearchaeota archaeon]
MVEKKDKKKIKIPERARIEGYVEEIIELGKKRVPPAKIGLIIKQKYSIPKVKILGKKISSILRENNIEIKNDAQIVEERIKKLEAHCQKNIQDKRAKRDLVRYVHLKRKLERYQEKQTK